MVRWCRGRPFRAIATAAPPRQMPARLTPPRTELPQLTMSSSFRRSPNRRANTTAITASFSDSDSRTALIFCRIRQALALDRAKEGREIARCRLLDQDLRHLEGGRKYGVVTQPRRFPVRQGLEPPFA